MTPSLRRWMRRLAIAVCACGYAVLAHFSNSHPTAQALGVALAVGPLLLLIVACCWRTGQRLLGLLSALLASSTVALYWPFLAAHFAWLYLLQQAGAYGFLGLVFGRSLGSGRVPMCTYWATLVHGSLPPALARYTRQVTLAWTLFFVTMATALVVVFMLAPLSTWSAFANFGALPLVAAMFIGEYLVRSLVLPDAQRGSIFDAARAFMESPGGPDTVRRG